MHSSELKILDNENFLLTGHLAKLVAKELGMTLKSFGNDIGLQMYTSTPGVEFTLPIKNAKRIAQAFVIAANIEKQIDLWRS